MSDEIATAAPEEVLAWFPRATYLGGVSKVPPIDYEQNIIFSNERIGLGDRLPRMAHITWNYVTGITVDGGEFAKSRVANVLAFGVLGLGAKSTEGRVYFTVHLNFGEKAVFMVRKADIVHVRAVMGPVLAKLGLPMGEPAEEVEAPPVSPAPSTDPNTRLLKEVAHLHEAGILTDAEFAAKTALVLAQM